MSKDQKRQVAGGVPSAPSAPSGVPSAPSGVPSAPRNEAEAKAKESAEYIADVNRVYATLDITKFSTLFQPLPKDANKQKAQLHAEVKKLLKVYDPDVHSIVVPNYMKAGNKLCLRKRYFDKRQSVETWLHKVWRELHEELDPANAMRIKYNMELCFIPALAVKTSEATTVAEPDFIAYIVDNATGEVFHVRSCKSGGARELRKAYLRELQMIAIPKVQTLECYDKTNATAADWTKALVILREYREKE